MALLAVGVVFVTWALPDLLGFQTPVTLFAIALIPIAIMIAILRYQLLDIRLVSPALRSTCSCPPS
jgi:hypothetical protein